jgi:programmed cell death protein 5
MSEDLDDLRQKRLKELQNSALAKQQEEELNRQREEQRQEQEMQKQAILRQILTEGARQRLANIKLVKPSMAESIENQLIQLAQVGRISPNSPITEDQLLQMLRKLQDTKRDSTIRFKRV